MNRYLSGIAALILSGGLAQADVTAPPSMPLLAQSPTGNSNNPYNSPIRRANPNSMQGTQPNVPALQGPNTVPVPRPPTLENRGIGNGQSSRPAPGAPPVFIPNPPMRDTGNNR